MASEPLRFYGIIWITKSFCFTLTLEKIRSRFFLRLRYTNDKWAASWQNQQLCAQQRLRSAWAAVRMKKAWVLSYPLSAQRRLWSDWADAQADPSLGWAHMPHCWLCHVAAQIKATDVRNRWRKKILHFSKTWSSGEKHWISRKQDFESFFTDV